MPTTIKDISEKTGYSHITVSRALNGAGSVKKETKEYILEVAKELKYVPNEFARSLKLNRSNNIGLFFSSIHGGTTSYFFYQFFSKMEEAINGRFNIVVKGIESYTGDYTKISKQNFCGIVVVSQSCEDDNFIKEIIKKDIPVVVVNRETEVKGVTTVCATEDEGVEKAVSYLVDEGHLSIGLLKGNADYSATHIRELGYRNGHKKNNIRLNELLIENGTFDALSGYVGLKKLHGRNEKLSAVICMNDEIATGALKAMNELEIEFPVIGFDNHDLGPYIGRGLSTIEKPIEEMCEAAVSNLINSIENGIAKEKHIKYFTKLIIR